MPTHEQTREVMARLALCVFMVLWFVNPAQAQTSDQGGTQPSATLEALPQGGAEAILRQKLFADEGRHAGTDSALRLGFEAYNLGTQYLTAGDPGSAHAWLMVASSLVPDDPDTEHNLNLARRQLEARIGRDGVLLARAPWEEFISTTTASRLIQLFGLLLLVVPLGVTALRKAEQNGTEQSSLHPFRPSTPSLVSLLSGLLLIVGSQWMASELSAAQAALSMPVTLRSGPAESFVNLGALPGGVVLPVLQARVAHSNSADRNERWLQVRYAPSKLAWIPESACLPLSKNWP